MSNSISEQAVLFSEKRCVGSSKKIAIATLNAEKSLNSLSLAMVDLIAAEADKWAADDNIVAVLIDSAGDRAFAAGGDIRMLYESMVECGENYNAYATDFFSREYRLDYRLHNFTKPIITWGNGFVMGGGMGVFEGGAFRVVTENTRIAMPEIGVGLFPDVGGSYFLNQARGNTGLFLAMTGAQINANDAIYTGLADVFIPHGEKVAMLDSLAELEWVSSAESNRESINRELVAVALAKIENQHEDQLPASQLQAHEGWIESVTSKDSLEAVSAAISAYDGDDKWLSRAVSSHQRGCPVSIFLAYELHQLGKNLPLADVFRLELIAAINCCKYGVFQEGVRAQIIEKDNAPNFVPATLAELSAEIREQYLSSPWADGAHPLADL
ncbi:MAG: enoyl-CoA hydratase/isomerase family protein [Porticoccaceae bacterium]|nr:enoyl-CoA hydratase/isomerase family protein [Porticoccaceae bacterium]